MDQFMYTVWIKDHSDKMEKQGYEYPACIIIEANDLNSAKEWGDRLSLRLSKKNPESEIIHSKIEDLEQYKSSDLSSIPIIRDGYEASDEEIGW